MRPLMLWRPHATMQKMLSAFAAAGSWATAPARARDGRSPASLLDNWLKGRRRAVWISKSDKLIEDAQRDWSALGMERLLVTPLSRFPAGHADPACGRRPFHHLRFFFFFFFFFSAILLAAQSVTDSANTPPHARNTSLLHFVGVALSTRRCYQVRDGAAFIQLQRPIEA